MADLHATEVPDVVDYVVKDTKGEETDIVFQLAGPGHPERLKLEGKGWSRTARIMNKHGGKIQVDENWDAVFDKATATLVAITLGWRNVTNGNGEEIPFSPEKARELYENRRSNLRTQILAENERIAGFTLNSSIT